MHSVVGRSSEPMVERNGSQTDEATGDWMETPR
jgi:hypothetical protein